MNRKGRAKLNNQLARAKRERAACPNAGKILLNNPSDHCDTCGDKLVPIPTVTYSVVDTANKSKLN